MTIKLRQAVECEKLLQWAYLDELSKEHTSAAEGIWDMIRAGIFRDDGRGRGCAQRYSHFGLPHPDALRIEQAVNALPDYSAADIDPEWLMGDLIALYRQRDWLMTHSIPTKVIVMKSAILGRPDWYPDPPTPHGLPAERGPNFTIRGKCRGKNLYTLGTHCPIVWEPPAIDIARGRADYVAWWHGISALAATLDLEAHIATAPAAPVDPWRTAEVRGKIYASAYQPAKRLPLAPSRPWAGPRFSRPRASAGRRVVG